MKMNDEHLTRILRDAYPDTPEIFHQRLSHTVELLVQQKKRMRHRMIYRAVAIALGIILLTGTALALVEHFGVLNFNGSTFSLPEAQSMIQYDLCSARTGSLIWRVEEVIYDGRIMRILYSMTDTTITSPWTVEDQGDDQGNENAYIYYENATRRENVALHCDGNGAVSVNGTSVNLRNVQLRLSEDIGKIEFWVDCKMEYFDQTNQRLITLFPEGYVTVSMDFVHLENDGTALPEPMSFSLSTGDTVNRYAIKKPEPYTLSSGETLIFTDLHFSPATICISYNVLVPKKCLPDDYPTSNDHNELFEYDMTHEDSDLLDIRYYVSKLQNGKGEIIGADIDGSFGYMGFDEQGNLMLCYTYESIPDDNYTDVTYMILNHESVPIPMILAYDGSD